MDHKNTFIGKQLKRKLLEKHIFGKSSHELAILVFGITKLTECILKQLI